MKKEYKEAGIAGKFRMLHIAHQELIVQATSKTEHLHVFIVDTEKYRRYATLEQVIETFRAIFAEIRFDEYSIHIINEELSGESWDKKVLSLAPDIEVMFDSKEIYENVLIKNEYIQLIASREISVSAIEKAPFTRYHASLVVPFFWQYMQKKIVFLDNDKQRIQQFIERLSIIFDIPQNNVDIPSFQRLYGRLHFSMNEENNESCQLFYFQFGRFNETSQSNDRFNIPMKNEGEALSYIINKIQNNILGGSHE